MKLSANTFVYEVGKVPITKALSSIKNFGFQYVDLAAYQSCDPTMLSEEEKREIIKIFHDLELKSSQLLLVNTQEIASTNSSKREKVMNYMKECVDFQLELGGKQVLVCWGCGVYESNVLREENWLNSVKMLQEFGRWANNRKILVDLEMDPHVYFVVGSMEKMAKMLEDVNLPNVFPNVDIGHMCITREAPQVLKKFKDRIIHVHISETDTFEHTNSIIGTGKADFKSYIEEVIELGIELTCERYGEVAVAGIEMGEPGGEVDDPDRWMRESLLYLKKILPELSF